MTGDWFQVIIDNRRGIDEAMRKACERAVDEACKELREKGIHAERRGPVDLGA